MDIALLLVAGLGLLVGGGELLVRGAVALARRLGVPPLVIGLTLVGFGTSTPELVTSVKAALAGAPDLAVGNVVGSNIANTLLIIGLSALISPIACDPAALRRDGSVMALTSLVAVGLAWLGSVGLGAGLLLLGALLVYTGTAYMQGRRAEDPAAPMLAAEAEAVGTVPTGLAMALGLCGLGMAGVLVGAGFLVDGAVALARVAGLSEAVIGLTIVAVGTSLPELVVSITGALRGQADVAFGNIVGSNIFNVLGILGATALVQPLGVPAQIAALDIWVMLAATAVFMLFAVTGLRVVRWEGAVLLTAYLAYVAALLLLSVGPEAGLGG